MECCQGPVGGGGSQEIGVLLTSYVENVLTVLIPTGVPAYRLQGLGGKWCPPAIFFLEKSQ